MSTGRQNDKTVLHLLARLHFQRTHSSGMPVINVIRDARDIMVHDINIRLIYIFCFRISVCRSFKRGPFVCNLFTMLIKNAFNCVVRSNQATAIHAIVEFKTMQMRILFYFDGNGFFTHFSVSNQMDFKRIRVILKILLLLLLFWIVRFLLVFSFHFD